MTDMMYLLMGVVAGLVTGGTGLYLWPYSVLRRDYSAVQNELGEAQAKNNELQAALLEGQAHAYQTRQTVLLQQKRTEGQLTTAHERHAELENQLAILKADAEQQRNRHQHEAALLRTTIARLEQEQEALQDRFARQGTEWERERQSLQLQTAQLDGQILTLQRDRQTVENRMEQQQEAGERERLALQIQMNTLEDNLTLHQARAGQMLPPDGAKLLEQVRAEAATELNWRQMAWEDERQTLLGQVERLQAERQALQRTAMEAATATPEPALTPAGEEVVELRRQWERERQERKSLEEKLTAQERQAEQKHAALETEIEQLMDRLLRIHRERNG